MLSRSRRPGPAVGWIAGAAVSSLAVHALLQQQAGVARRVIGRPLGEDGHRADRVYKSKYGEPIELLVLGDSIAAGLGADKPKHTLGAQLAERLAEHTQRSVRLHTAAHVGAETSMLRCQLAGLPAGYLAEVAVIVVGGNDVTHQVPTSVSRAHLEETVCSLQEQAIQVVVGTCPDLGALPALPQPLQGPARVASRRLAAAQREVTIRQGGHAVPLADVVGPFLVAAPEQPFALDRFHPSKAGYRRIATAILPHVLAALGDEEPAWPVRGR